MPASEPNKALEMIRGGSLEPLLFVVERGGRVLNVSESVVRIAPNSEDDVVGSHLREFLIGLKPDWKDLLPLSVFGFLSQEVFLPWNIDESKGLGWNVHGITMGSGKEITLSLSFVPCLASERPGVIPEDGFSQDVGQTMHKLFLRAQQSDLRFRRFLKLLPGISIIQNADLNFDWRGSELRMLFGNDAYEQLKFVSWTDWIHVSDRTDFFNGVMRCKKSHFPVSSKLRLSLPNKKTIYLLDIRFPIIGLDGKVSSYEVLWIDLSRQRTAERRLHESAWKESLSEISGSMTHDFNNLMTGITNLSAILCRDSDEERIEVDRSNINLIWESAKQAQTLLQQVVSLNQKKPGKVELFNLNSFVESQYDLIRIVLPQRLRFEIKTLDEELPVRLDQVALSRTILNFATNARDAIEGKGSVELSLKIVDLADYPRTHIFSGLCPRYGRAVELRFSDTGCGISPHHINQIFCAYFSTKSEKKGSGLGLSSLYRYAEENGFDFGVRSKLGHGSEMLLLLPLDEIRPDTCKLPLPEKQRAFLPGRNDKLSVTLFDRDSKYAGFMEANFAEDYGVYARVMTELQDVIAWLDSEHSRHSVFIARFELFDDIPGQLLERLDSSFSRTNRILILSKEDPTDLLHDPSKQIYFDDLLQSTQEPSSDCQSVLRSLGHKSLFARQEFY